MLLLVFSCRLTHTHTCLCVLFQATLHSPGRVVRIVRTDASPCSLQIASLSVLGCQLVGSTLQATFARMFELHRDNLMFGVRAVCTEVYTQRAGVTTRL